MGQQEHHEFHYREMLSPALREEKVQPPGQARGSWLEISSAVKDPGVMVDKLSMIQQCVLAVKKENGILPPAYVGVWGCSCPHGGLCTSSC